MQDEAFAVVHIAAGGDAQITFATQRGFVVVHITGFDGDIVFGKDAAACVVKRSGLNVDVATTTRALFGPLATHWTHIFVLRQVGVKEFLRQAGAIDI